MTRWQQILREHDPVAPLTADDAHAIRQRVIVEARAHARPGVPLRLAPVFALGGALAVAAMAGVFIAKAHPQMDAPPATMAAPGAIRQLQFATPGGTRIIWQFNPDFTMQGTIP